MLMPSSLHHHTPSLTAYDPRALSVRQVAYHRTLPRAQAVPRISSQMWSATGLLLAQWDPRLHTQRQHPTVTGSNQNTLYSLSGQPLHSHSVDAGSRWWLRGSAGQVLQSRDSRGSQQRHVFDRWFRLTSRHEREAGEPRERCVEILTYGGTTPEDQAANRSGRLIRHDDPSGTLRYEQYSLKGQLLKEARQFCQSLEPVDWPQAESGRDALLETSRFITAWQYDAFASVIGQTDAKGHTQHLSYGIDGLLFENALTLKGERRQVLMSQRVYNASAQLESERAANNVSTLAQYAAPDGRLERLLAYREAESAGPLQDLAYEYDRVGNVTKISDGAQPVQWAFNAQVDPVSTYGYDTLYQLIYATGRENANNDATRFLPPCMLFGMKDDTVWRNYRQVYAYDEAGNLLQLRHSVNTGGGYRQRMAVADASNHGVLQEDPGVTPPTPGLGRAFDMNGNQQALSAGQALQWSVANQLRKVTFVQRSDGQNDDEVYRYDASGQRVQKVHTSQASTMTHTRMVRYLPGLEIRHDSATGEQLNVVCVSAGLSSIRVLQWDQGRARTAPETQIRFSLVDLVGSSSLELDGRAQLITQESYYPYGATAWWAARTSLQARYKTIRYSGKEMDASGLYYYGMRYYAPWLQRWISPDPAGTLDGLNRYAMVSNNPVSRIDLYGLNGVSADTRPARVQAIDRYLRENFPAIYLKELDTFTYRHSLTQGPHADIIGALRTQGFNFDEMDLYNQSVSLGATRPANILAGLGEVYIASANYFNETARYMTNPAIHPDNPGAWLWEDIPTMYSAMERSDATTFDPDVSGMSDALSIGRESAVTLFNQHILRNPGTTETTTYRGQQVSELGLRALEAHAQNKDILRTEQFMSVSDMMSVAKRFAFGTYDTRKVTLKPVMFTVKGTSAMELLSPVNEAERVYPLESTFTIKSAGFSQAVVKAYAPFASHFVLQEVSIPESTRKTRAFMTDPHGSRRH